MSGAGDEPVRVMLVDDDDRFRELLRQMLEEDGFPVTADVSTAARAVDALAEADPTVIVLDYTLPDGDGIALAERVRRGRPDLHVIIFSSLFDVALRRDAEDRGLAYLEKVDGLDALERRIIELVGGAGDKSAGV
jgi:DNA-binding NarL/FixJ family response regulator